MNLLTLSIPLVMIGRAASPGDLAVTPSSDSVERYGIYELTLSHPDGDYPNPWEDAAVSARFDGPDGWAIHVDGFYYDRDTWKVRFTPPKDGDWKVALRFEAGDEERAWDGSFSCTPSSRRGFIRIHPRNPFRLVFEDGSLFDGVGIGDCIRDYNETSSALNCWGFDGDFRAPGKAGHHDYGWVVDVETYMSAYGAGGAGINLFRWSIDNCAFELWDTISPDGNRYLVREGKWGDKLVESLRRNGFRIWLTFFGFKPAFPEGAGNTAEEAAVKRYLRYAVARYGAYVDIWELMNEANVPDQWITFAADYVREIDPYQRLIATSWERPGHPSIDLNTPHWYQKESEFESDLVTARKIEEAKKWGKPVLFGEQGNSVQNWDERSGLRMRLRLWTAFFEEGILVFWNSSFAKDYKSGAANLYIGPEERSQIRALRDFTGTVPADAVRLPVSVEAEGVRAYGLASDSGVLGYFHHFADHENEVSAKIRLDLPREGRAEWIDPATGRVLRTDSVDKGEITLETPPFIVDLALRVELESGE